MAKQKVKSAPTVALGTVWFVWGYHQRVHKESTNAVTGEREVLIVPLGKKPGKRPPHYTPWVAAWRVEKYGELSLVHND